MADETVFAELVERAMAETGGVAIRPVIEKELLHYDILFCLDQQDLLDTLTFQGGTALRLCYGSRRLSEGLDFAGGSAFSSAMLEPMRQSLEDYIGSRYGLEIQVKEPDELRREPEYRGLNVDKWQIAVNTAPARPDLPTQRIKLEVANVPAYSRVPRSLAVHYGFLPDGYGDTLVLTETLDEILADKLISLVNTEAFVRYRDIWDLRWLKQQGAELNAQWLRGKIRDYRIEGYREKVSAMRARLPGIVHGSRFRDEMTRFLPTAVQDATLAREKFLVVLADELDQLLEAAGQAAGG